MITLKAHDQTGMAHDIALEAFTCSCCESKGVAADVDGIPCTEYRAVRNQPELTVFFLEDGSAEILKVREDALRRAVGILTPEEFAQGM